MRPVSVNGVDEKAVLLFIMDDVVVKCRGLGRAMRTISLSRRSWQVRTSSHQVLASSAFSPDWLTASSTRDKMFQTNGLFESSRLSAPCWTLHCQAHEEPVELLNSWLYVQREMGQKICPYLVQHQLDQDDTNNLVGDSGAQS
jgi:hypothetical protein